MTKAEFYKAIKDKEAVTTFFDLLSRRAPAEAIREAELNLGVHDWKLCRQIIMQIKQGEKIN